MKKYLIFIVFLFIAILTKAQVDLDVTVSDITSQPLADISVKLENNSIGFSQTLITGPDGIVKFRGLSTSGSYKVDVSETTVYAGDSKSDILLRSNYNPSITIVLLKKNEINLESVKITGNRSAQINTVNAEVASELKLSEIKQIPVEGRDITRILYRLPNVTQATGFFPEAPNVSINGSNGLFTNYLIDGMDNN